MNLYRCPNCKDPGGEFDFFPSRENYRWYEIGQKRISCRHCRAELALEKSFQKWGLLALPAIVISVWDIALASEGGVKDTILYAAWGLAIFGLAMLYAKRKLVVVKQPSNKRIQPDRPAVDR